MASQPTLGRPLVLREAFGSEVPEIAPEDLRHIPVPRLAEAAEQAIADQAEEATAARQRANAVEDQAVAQLEAGTPVVVLVADLDVRVLTEDGALLRELTLDPIRDYQRQAPA